MPCAPSDPTAANPSHDGAAPQRCDFDLLRGAIAALNADDRAAPPRIALRLRSHGLPVHRTAATAPLDGGRADTAARPAIPAGGPATAAGARG